MHRTQMAPLPSLALHDEHLNAKSRTMSTSSGLGAKTPPGVGAHSDRTAG